MSDAGADALSGRGGAAGIGLGARKPGRWSGDMRTASRLGANSRYSSRIQCRCVVIEDLSAPMTTGASSFINPPPSATPDDALRAQSGVADERDLSTDAA